MTSKVRGSVELDQFLGAIFQDEGNHLYNLKSHH